MILQSMHPSFKQKVIIHEISQNISSASLERGFSSKLHLQQLQLPMLHYHQITLLMDQPSQLMEMWRKPKLAQCRFKVNPTKYQPKPHQTKAVSIESKLKSLLDTTTKADLVWCSSEIYSTSKLIAFDIKFPLIHSMGRQTSSRTCLSFAI